MTNYQNKPPAEAWHLDKRVPLAMILMIAAQTAAVAWGAGQIVSRVDFLERDVERQRVLLEADSTSIHDLDRTLGRQDEKMNSILRILEDVKSDLDDFKAEQKEVLDKISR
ncbi:MAG: hypothetical protein AAFQ04_09055 [Pseudomonadota bacterium]